MYYILGCPKKSRVHFCTLADISKGGILTVMAFLTDLILA